MDKKPSIKWVTHVEVLMDVFRFSGAEGKHHAKAEFRRMAALADLVEEMQQQAALPLTKAAPDLLTAIMLMFAEGERGALWAESEGYKAGKAAIAKATLETP